MNDIKGYYARLEISSSASANEIKSAYRINAKRAHPDSAAINDGGVEFRSISEAYVVLSDPEKRADYDSFCATTSQNSESQNTSTPIEPIVCSRCNIITAQPRYVVFRQVVSIIFTTIRTPIQGIYCAACARRVGLKATMFSAVIGWWGIPWGPILTVGEIFKNAWGGSFIVANEEMLLWHNALAFSTRGDGRVSFALAEKLRTATNQEIANNAVRLQDYLLSKGVPRTLPLKSPWGIDAKSTTLHLFMLLAIPSLVIGGIYLGDKSKPESMASFDSSVTDKLAPQLAISSFRPTEPDLTAIANNDALPKCVVNPRNGKVLSGPNRLQPKGHVLEIQNGSGGDAIIKLRDAEGSKRSVASFFVANNATASLTGVPDGRYVVQYAFGSALGADCRTFNEITSSGQFPDSETLATERTETETGYNIRRMRISYTLYSVPSGNVHPQTLDPKLFNAE